MKLNNIPLELNERIYDIGDIKTVITADEKDVGKMGYFANSIHLFKNLEGLDGIKYGKLIYLSDLNQGGDKSDKCFVCSNHWAYRYFIPEDSLLPEEPEKKYRPYTVMEFIKEYPLGSHLHFRPKSETMEMHRLIDGYNDCKNGSGTLFLCGAMFSMSELYDNYDIFKDGEWQPFGVLDEENEEE